MVVISGSAFFGLKIPSILRYPTAPIPINTAMATMSTITFALVLMLPIGFLIELFLEFLGIIFSFL